MTSSHIARQMWTRFEPLHAVTYFTPEARAAYEAVGLHGYWRGYFAGRFAPMGPVDAVPVVSAAFGFAPRMVARAVPDVWSRATPEAALTARREGGEAALTRMLADCDAGTFGEVAALADEAVSRLERGGHPLGAANAALTVPEGAGPLARLWQAATTMREHRGDSHVAALVAYGFNGIESVIWRCAPEHRADMQSYRGWTDDEWDAASERLVDRGWLRKDGTHTPQGDTVYAAVEAATDRANARVWHDLGNGRTERLRELLTPLAVATYSGIPLVNPVGVPTTAEADAAAVHA